MIIIRENLVEPTFSTKFEYDEMKKKKTKIMIKNISVPIAA